MRWHIDYAPIRQLNKIKIVRNGTAITTCLLSDIDYRMRGYALVDAAAGELKIE